MRYALVNPPWDFEGSIYFGCREPHLPLELGYARQLLEAAGHTVLYCDAHLESFSLDDVRKRLRDFKPHFTVFPTAPTYLFWRCAPPELRVPQMALNAVRDVAGTTVVIGPHGSTTPRPTLRKLDADVVMMGEPEEVLAELTGTWENIRSLCYRRDTGETVTGVVHYTDMSKAPALKWADRYIRNHHHHHHRFDAEPKGPGAEVEASRGCPYHCTFCAKDNFRNEYRRRPTATVLEEVDALIAQGVEYIYFIDEIFIPQRDLLRALAERDVKIGVQTRIDLWNEEAIQLLAAAHCVSIEAGVESITEEGRAVLDKKCKLSTGQLFDRLVFAKRVIPFVQANLLAMEEDSAEEMEAWRQNLLEKGVWANKPVPLFPYPGSPEYTRRWGKPDDFAWERAHEYYLNGTDTYSDIQNQDPAELVQLELNASGR
jgi:B12-binding domain/radical SAM domain protein of rhizo-twelve system